MAYKIVLLYGVVVLMRLSAPLLIFKKPFWGMVVSMIADDLDFTILRYGWQWLHVPTPFNYEAYQIFDKILDTVMYSCALYVTRSWDSFNKKTALGLFVYRAVGVIIFFFSGARYWFVVFPNVFEFYFLYVSCIRQYIPNFHIDTKKRLAIVLIIVSIPKLLQEYSLHILPVPPWSSYSLFEINRTK